MPFIFMKRKYYQFCYGSDELEKRIRFDSKKKVKHLTLNLIAIVLNATVSKQNKPIVTGRIDEIYTAIIGFNGI